MKINTVVIAIVVIAILGFLYFIIKRNRKDQQSFEDELNGGELTNKKHKEDQV
jgi:preprotein translocase subunit YajC